MIRDASAADSKALSEIYNHYIRNTVITFEESEIDVTDIARRIKKVQAAGGWWLVAEAAGRVVGYAYCSTWNERSAYRNTVEVSVYLAPASLGRRYGTALYEEIFRRLKNTSIHIVVGGIALPNPQSVALHEKFGMAKVAHFKEVGYKFNQWIDVGYWQVKLNS